jgi:cytochrome c peroxidase
MRAALVLCVVVAATVASSIRAADRWPPLGLDLFRPAPLDNPITPEKIALGRDLFRERRLSRDGTLSCAGCHDPSRAFSGSGPVARGVGGARGTRNVPAIVNRAWGAAFFWDGRAATLEDQVRQPILNPSELGSTAEAAEAVARSPRYVRRFHTAFGTEPTFNDVAHALAAYVRTIVAGDAPYDRYLSGDTGALGREARRGLGLFVGRARCANCHGGPLFSDERFHNTGVAWRGGALVDDGRGGVTGRIEDRGAFKTPSLRELMRTAPYMHDGSLATLADVIGFYDRGGQPNPGLDPGIRPLGLRPSEKQDLEAFLRALTGRVMDGS